MTPLQKVIITVLLEGGSIANCGSSGMRLRDKDQNPVRKIRSYWAVRHVVRMEKGVYVIDKRKVRQLHGKSFIKQQYKKLQDGRKI